MTSFEPDRSTLEAWLQRLATLALDHVEGLEQAPASGAMGADALEVAARVSTPIPEAPLPGGLDRIAELLELATTAGLGTAGPGYLAYIPGGGLPSAALAEMVAALINRYTGVSAASPALCRLESDVLTWLAREVGYADGARGLLTSGGSLANFSAVVTARHARLGEDGDYRRAMVYISSQAHHSVSKSVALAGIPARNVRAVEVDHRLRMDVGSLRQAVEADLGAGARPFLVVSAAGTTNTGAIDPLPEIGEVCRRHGLWHHVDGAYGGAFVLCPEGRRRLQGIAQADSVTLDPHKGMFLPYGTGCLLVRDGAQLRAAHQAHAVYLQDFEQLDRSTEAPSPSDHGPELSRPFRGLRLWLPLMLHGAAAFRAALEEKLELAAALATQLRHIPCVEVVDEPQLSVVPFRLRVRPGESVSSHDGRNRQWLAAINEQANVHLSSTSLPVQGTEVLTLRACVLSFRTHRPRIDALLRDAASTAMRYTGSAT